MSQHFDIAFCGVGSIARRHILNTAACLERRGHTFSIDVLRSGKGAELPPEIRGKVCGTYGLEERLTKQYDVLFVTNPTARHAETIAKYAPFARHMFIEKPVFDRTDIVPSSLGLREGGIYFVACPLRYTHVLQYVKKHLPCDQAYSVRAICSSYLPDWRPGMDYRETYSAHRAMGGGVSIDLIHEWDYLTHLFGFPEKVLCASGTFSHLEIDSEDLAAYIGVSSGRILELHLDYFGRAPIRELQMFFREETVTADLLQGTISFLREGRMVDVSEERNDFQLREIEHFFDILAGVCENDNDIPRALRTLRIAKGETSA